MGCAFIGMFLMSLSFFLQAPNGTGWRDPFPGVQPPQTVPYLQGTPVPVITTVAIEYNLPVIP